MMRSLTGLTLQVGAFRGREDRRDDVALLGFTSGTTGVPKATMHFHRDILAIADTYARNVLRVTPEDIFVGTPPLAFTFGLGGLAVFPLRFGATAALLETATPPNLVSLIEELRATICFTAPTAYRAMLAAMAEGADLSSLRIAVSAGETLPAPVYEAWTRKTGKPILDGTSAPRRCCTSSSRTRWTIMVRDAPGGPCRGSRRRSWTRR